MAAFKTEHKNYLKITGRHTRDHGRTVPRFKGGETKGKMEGWGMKAKSKGGELVNGNERKCETGNVISLFQHF